MMSISETAFRFSQVLNQNRHKYDRYIVTSLQVYVRDEMFKAIKNKIPSQEYYMNTKQYIEEVLNSPNDAA